MGKWFTVVVISLVTVQFRAISANGNSSTSSDERQHEESIRYYDLFTAWIERPPYVTSAPNGSLDNEVHGLIRDVIFRYIAYDCGRAIKIGYKAKTFRTDSEFGMIEMLRQNKVHLAIPVFEPKNPRYREFPFLKLADYPGTDFITTEDETTGLNVVLDAVLKSWPLLAVTLILTAIAGVIVWALDTYWNSEEFPRSFIRGSWDGFWWSFISMTTVGYGDKSPKSVVARVFSIIWIMFGLIIMAIFTANITSALTALSLQLEPSSLAGLNVAVLGNLTEYQHALEEDAKPTVFYRIDDMIQAVKSKQVDGMLLDRYTASYYQSRNQLKSLYTVKKLELQRDIGILFNENRKFLAECLLNYHGASIWGSVQTITATYKLPQTKPPTNINLFDESSPFIKKLLHISLGVLAGLLLIGTLWNIFLRRKRANQTTVSEAAAFNKGIKTNTIQDSLEVARQLLQQTQEQFVKLEFQVSRLKYDQ